MSRAKFHLSFAVARKSSNEVQFLVMLPRGIRNNNPLNIRRSKDKWKGLRAVQADAQFCQFESLEYGWRAAFYLLTRTYYHKYRLYTIRAIISKWAPPCENNSKAYVENVSRLTGIDPDEPIGIPSERPARWIALGMAMAIQENGFESLDYFAMLRGWEMCRQDALSGH
jgi:hypothetical protein